MCKFINRCRSYYSLLDSTISIDELIKHSQDMNNEYVFLVDKDVSSVIEFYYKTIETKLKPIFGLEIIYDNTKYILVAKNNLGYHNLIKISSMIKINQDYELDDFIEGLLIICFNNQVKKPSSNFYYSNELAINDVRYLNKKDYESYKALVAIRDNKLLDEVNIDNNYYFLSNENAKHFFDQELIIKTFNVLKDCVLQIDEFTIKIPKFNIQDSISSRKYLEQLCKEGLIKKLNIQDGLIDKKYAQRLLYEIDVIDKMNFIDYFLIVQDFVNFAKNNNIVVGPGRGSAAGSLVSYALNITEIDPIKNNLIFERFLNPDRKSLPDIDIDVMDIRRQEVIDYIFNKYGKDNTCYIATFQRIKAKMAIRDVGRCLGIDLKTIDTISKLIPFEYDSDLLRAINNNENLKSFYNTFPKLFDIATSLINIPRQVSTHAAGIVISNENITNNIGIQLGIDNWYLSQVSMEYVEKIGLIKIDILGLKNLSIINSTINLIKQHYHQVIDLQKIDYDDKKLFDEISQANTIGIFQLESPGMRSTLRKVKVNSIEDISIVSALFRPGPQSMINDYVKTKNGELEETYVNDNLKPILKPTLGFCIYQEQVIELIKSVAGLSTSEADVFRRAISKKKEDLFENMRKTFIDGATKNNYSQEQSNKIFNYLLDFANYGFNHSHSLSYAYISYQMMYLKYYYPLEFFLTLLKYGDSSNHKNDTYISEAKQNSIKIFNTMMTKSDINFSDYNNGIIFGFANIKGIGVEIAKKIINIRSNNDFTKGYIETISLLANNGINKRTIESLIKVGAFDEYSVDRLFLLTNLDEIIENASFKIDGNFVFGLNLKQTKGTLDEKTKADYELELLNYSFSNNKYLEKFNLYKDKFNLKEFNIKKVIADENYLINVKSVKNTMTRYGKKMSFINFESEFSNFEIACFNLQIIEQIKANNYFVVNLSLDKNNRLTISKIVQLVE